MNTPKNENNPKTKEELEKEKRESEKEDTNEGSGYIPPMPEGQETPRKHDDPMVHREPGTL